MTKWFFDNDEHFLRSYGIQPWPEADYPTIDLDETRIMNLFPQSDYFENVPEHAFNNDTNVGQFQFPVANNVDYEMMVREEIAEQVSNFLTFSTKSELLKFINSLTD